MDGPESSSDQKSLDQAYPNLISLWTDAVRDYNSLLSDYLTANSICNFRREGHQDRPNQTYLLPFRGHPVLWFFVGLTDRP